MLFDLRKHLGTPIYETDEEVFYCFPTLEELLRADEQQLRALGFGYRARFVCSTVQTVKQEGGEAYLKSLRSVRDRKTVQAALCRLSGIGPKVADCIALFSLDQPDAIPVDTHVWQIACRDFDASLMAST